MRLGRAVAVAGLVGSMALLVAYPVTIAEAAFPGSDGVLGFASTGNLGTSNNTGGTQIIFQATPQLSPPASFTNVVNVTTHSGGTDASPFYSADGKWVYFSSNSTTANGNFALYSLPAGVSPGASNDARVLVDTGNDPGTADDLVPTVNPSGSDVFFIRDTPNAAIWQVPVSNGAPTAAPTLCYDPQNSVLAPTAVKNPPAVPDARVGDSSRVVFDPQDGSKFVYEDSAGQLHLVNWPNGVCNPTGASDTTITSPSNGVAGASGDFFENPDWSPNSSTLILNTNAFAGTLGPSVLATLAMSPLPGAPVAVQHLWASTALILACSGTTPTNAQGHEYQPVYSPLGDAIAFTEASCSGGSQTEFLDPGMAASNADAVVTSTNSPNSCTPASGSMPARCRGIDSEPDWQPLPGTGAVLPEAPLAVLLPMGGMGLAALVLVLQRRRGRLQMHTA